MSLPIRKIANALPDEAPSFHRCRVEHGGRGGARGRPGARASGKAAVPALGGILSRPRSRPRRVGCDLHPRDGESQTRHAVFGVERDYGVDPFVMLGLWGMESAFGDVVVNLKHMRPVMPALATLAWGEPRRRSYWEQELTNALVIIERGWSSPEEMIGSWAGAMGHTQWMPEVWLHMGVDYDHDGRISPYGKPDDAIAGTARYLAQRGHYRRGEAWGYEVRLPGGLSAAAAQRMGNRSIAQWQTSGVVPADGTPFQRPGERAKAWVPIPGGPAFLIAQNFFAIRSYNPSNNYALAIAHLADRIRGKDEFVQKFPGGERTPTLEELQEIQRRLTALGFDTGGTDGRVGRDTMVAVQAFQRKTGLTPADGYAGLKVLARLRQGS